jgi:hypothetical protein
MEQAQMTLTQRKKLRKEAAALKRQQKAVEKTVEAAPAKAKARVAVAPAKRDFRKLIELGNGQSVKVPNGLDAPADVRVERGDIEVDAARLRSGSTDMRGVFRVKAATRLEAYYRDGKLNGDAEVVGETQEDRAKKRFDAGMKMMEAWQFHAQHVQTRDVRAPLQRGDSTVTEKIHLSKETLRQACDALSKAQYDVVMRVCCDDDFAGGDKKLATLRRGLDVLAALSPWPCIRKAEAWIEECKVRGKEFTDSRKNIRMGS